MSTFPRPAAVAVALGPLLHAALALAAPPVGRPQVPPLAVHQVRGPIHQVTGGAINNAGFYVGAKEVLVIDAKMTVAATREMVAQIKKLTANPITFVTLTRPARPDRPVLPARRARCRGRRLRVPAAADPGGTVECSGLTPARGARLVPAGAWPARGATGPWASRSASRRASPRATTP